MLNHFKPVLFFILVLMISLQCCKLNAQDTSETQPIIGTNQKIGDVILIALPVAALGTTLLKGDKKGAWQFTKGFVVTEAVTYGLKMSINKTRPDQSNDNSFPSGHTSTVFHSAGYLLKFRYVHFSKR